MALLVGRAGKVGVEVLTLILSECEGTPDVESEVEPEVAPSVVKSLGAPHTR